jgi:hypothetical protein
MLVNLQQKRYFVVNKNVFIELFNALLPWCNSIDIERAWVKSTTGMALLLLLFTTTTLYYFWWSLKILLLLASSWYLTHVSVCLHSLLLSLWLFILTLVLLSNMFVIFTSMHRYRKSKIDCLRFVTCPLLAPVFQGFFFCGGH